MAKTKAIHAHQVRQVQFLRSDQVRQAIDADVDWGLGVQLPKSAPDAWVGHYIYVPGYTPQGPVCVAWGRKQQMTWAWLDKYRDEAYAIFRARIPADC